MDFLKDSSWIDEAEALALTIYEKALSLETKTEKRERAFLAQILKDESIKALLVKLLDVFPRSKSKSRTLQQILYVLNKATLPKNTPFWIRGALSLFQWIAPIAPIVFVPLMKFWIYRSTKKVVIRGDAFEIKEHVKRRKQEGALMNINRIGEAVLGEEEALRRLQININDLLDPDIETISVKISSIYSQVHLLSYEQTLSTLAGRYRQLLRVAKENPVKDEEGQEKMKFIYLDMEEFSDLELTFHLFCQTLMEKEFLQLSCGIVLQAYLPDSFSYQKTLTNIAIERRKQGGAPLKLRIVKGANLSMESVHASIKQFVHPTYRSKEEVDANFKRMLLYGVEKERLDALHIGVGSHNLFDVCFALVLSENVENKEAIQIEMLEGMAVFVQKALLDSGISLLLYCPTIKPSDFEYALAYLIRRLDENTSRGHFLRYLFELQPNDEPWRRQQAAFRKAFTLIPDLRKDSYRHPQKRQDLPEKSPFFNEPDTDFTDPLARESVLKALKEKKGTQEDLPLIICGEKRRSSMRLEGFDPSRPLSVPYTFSDASISDFDEALDFAKEGVSVFSEAEIVRRSSLLKKTAKIFRQQRNELISALVLDVAKTVCEADAEVSEAIDFLEYYARVSLEMLSFSDVLVNPKGVCLVTSPWNFSCAIATGCIAAALATGNSVLFKPAIEGVYVGYLVALCFLEAGFSSRELQYITLLDEPNGLRLIQDKRVDLVSLTGGSATAEKFISASPSLDLIAETGGKNSMIVTDMSDKDLAIKSIVHSAFSYSGQKCSALSLLILEKSVYEDRRFLEQLQDAAKSLCIGSAYNLATKINPLIRPPEGDLLYAFETLDEGESWLLKPTIDKQNPRLMSPGIKMGVIEGSFMHQNELFGPILSVMKADDLDEAIHIASSTPYGLTAGIHSLDPREVKMWKERIEAGNLYVNRPITGSIVGRQPFGGCKESSFGKGLKAGGPNALIPYVKVQRKKAPPHQRDSDTLFDRMREDLNDDKELWDESIGSYLYYAKHFFSKEQELSFLLGQDNLFYYVPKQPLFIYFFEKDRLIDLYRAIAALHLCKASCFLYGESIEHLKRASWMKLCPKITLKQESFSLFARKLRGVQTPTIRIFSPLNDHQRTLLQVEKAKIINDPVLENGRFELIHYLREVSLSIDYHRYGNLGDREQEVRIGKDVEQ